MGRVSYLIQVGPIESHASLKAENLSQLWSDVMAEEGSERGNIAGSKDIGWWEHMQRMWVACKSRRGQGDIVPESFQKGHSPATPRCWADETLELLTHRIVR